MTARMSGKTAIVVGVSSVIGRACAHRLHREGASLILVDPDEDAIAEIAGALGDRVRSAPGAHASERDAASVAAYCARNAASIDALIYCGSSMETWPEADDDFEKMGRIIAENLLGPAMYTLALLPFLKAAQGAIVYLGSIDGIRGNPHVPAYSMGKGGLVPLTHSMAQRFGADGIRVNCVATAAIVQTPPSAGPLNRITGDDALLIRLTPLGRRPKPEEIASVMVFLASDDASYVTGAVLPVDGGRLAGTPGAWSGEP